MEAQVAGPGPKWCGEALETGADAVGRPRSTRTKKLPVTVTGTMSRSMTSKNPSGVFVQTVPLDYGQFYLLSLPAQNEAIEVLPQVAHTAIKRRRIATTEWNEVVVVISPH